MKLRGGQPSDPTTLYTSANLNSKPDLTENVDRVVWQKAIPAQIRQLDLHYYQHEEKVDGSVRE
jgi:hypothetical protein